MKACMPKMLAGAVVCVAGLAASSPTFASDCRNPDAWTGCYFGLHAGYRWVDADFTGAAYTAPGLGLGVFNFPARNESYDLDSGIIGIHLGYSKHRPSSNWLWGIEGDFTWGHGDEGRPNGGTVFGPDTGDPSADFTGRSEVEANWQATLRGRLGYVDGRWLYYVTAGVAWMDVSWRDSITIINPPFFTGTFNHSKDFVMTGYTVGGGVEKHLNNPLWRVRLEYLYEDFGNESVPFGATNPAQIGSLDVDAHKLRVGISRKFGYSDPPTYK